MSYCEELEIDCGILGEKVVTVHFAYSPPESQTWEQPGCDTEYEILQVIAEIGGIETDIYDFFSESGIIELEEVLEDVRVNNSDYGWE